MKLLSLRDVSVESKIELLKELGYDSDGTYIIKDGERVFDKYTEEDIRLDDMIIVPGSTLILDGSPLSVASYFEEYGDVF